MEKYDSKDSAKKRKRDVSRERRLNGSYNKWVSENRDKIKTYNNNRMSKNHIISDTEWNCCKEYFNNQCAYCGLLHKDHFISRKGKKIKSDFHKEHVDDQGAMIYPTVSHRVFRVTVKNGYLVYLNGITLKT